MANADLRNHTFTVTNGTITRSKRIEKKVRGVGENRRTYSKHWRFEVKPTDRTKAVSVSMPVKACNVQGALCTPGGLGLEAAQTIDFGIPGDTELSLSVGDISATEGSTLKFPVTFGRSSSNDILLYFSTTDGTAIKGEDYNNPERSFLWYDAGRSSGIIAIPTVDDSEDDDEETMTLTLTKAYLRPPNGSWYRRDDIIAVGDGKTATGTINNSGPIPKAWLGPFGRTVAEQVLDAVDGRFSSPGAPGAQASLGGQYLSKDTIAQLLQDTQGMSSRELLSGASFSVAGGELQHGVGSIWGRVAVSSFDSEVTEVAVDGRVTSVMLGTDFARENRTLGVLLAHSQGTGSYHDQETQGGRGDIESTITGLYPYGHYSLTDRSSVWAVAGYGAGTLEVRREGQGAYKGDMTLKMASIGGRNVLRPAEEGLEISVKPDALVVQTSSDRLVKEEGNSLAPAEATVSRLRVGLEGAWRGAMVEPSVDMGARHDSGDAETGFGIDLGGALTWAAASGFGGEVRARGLLAHEEDGFQNVGVSWLMSWDPTPESQRGLAITVSRASGAASSGGADALLNPATIADLSGDDGNQDRLEARIGYGFGIMDHRVMSVPEAGIALTDKHRDTNLGWKLKLIDKGSVSAGTGITWTHRQYDDGGDEQTLTLNAEMRW